MHILFISGMDTKYGEPQAMRQTIAGLRKYYPSVNISVILPIGISLSTKYAAEAEKYRALGCEVYRAYYTSCMQGVPISKWKTLIKYPVRLVQYLIGRYIGCFLLGQEIDWDEIDVIHANSSREDFGAILGRKYHKPVVWSIREFGDLDYRCFCYRRRYIQYMNQHADTCIAVSDVVRKHWIEKGISPQKIVTIYDGVNEEIVAKKDFSLADNHKLRFVLLGSVQETKGQNRLVEAIGMLPKEKIDRVSVDLVGGVTKSRFLSRLITRIQELKLEQTVKLLGFQENFRQHLSEYDGGLMCSNSEAFGLVTVEYMAAGLPVIAAGTGANPELIVDGECGFIYNPKDPVDLTKKIETFIDHPNLYAEMGRKAVIRVNESFSLKKGIMVLYRLYEHILHQ